MSVTDIFFKLRKINPPSLISRQNAGKWPNAYIPKQVLTINSNEPVSEIF